MKRLYQKIVTIILACMMIAGSVTGASAACSERVIYYGDLHSFGCADNNGSDASPQVVKTTLYDILRQIGCSDAICQKILSQLKGYDCNNICKGGDCPDNSCDNGQCPTQPEQPAPTEAPVPTEAPTQAPTQAPTAPSEKPIETTPPQQPVPTEKPTEPPVPRQDNALNAYEREVVSLINEIRAQNGLGQLSINTELSRVARIKSQDMHDKDYFSHTSPTYGSPFDMMKSFGIRYRTAGENIAMGYRTPQSVVDGWMNSPGHRANILNGSFKEIGMGYVASGNYWTQMFIG